MIKPVVCYSCNKVLPFDVLWFLDLVLQRIYCAYCANFIKTELRCFDVPK
jgi:hypothetical protein